MNRFEFNEVMKAMQLYTIEGKTVKSYFGPVKKYYWKNLSVWYTDYSVKIVRDYSYIGPEWDCDIFPEIKKTIYQKYPYISWNTFFSEDYRKTIPIITITTKDALILFLNEAYSYITGKKFGDFDELVKSVNEKIMGKINPTISAYEWMQTGKDDKEKYNSVLKKDLETELGRTFRQALDEFDKSVNPFLCEGTKLDNLGNVRIEADCGEHYFDSYDDGGKYCDGCCSLEFSDLSSYSKTKYNRYPSGFNFSLSYILDDYRNYHIAHIFYRGSEEIVITSNGKDHKNNICLRYNLTDGTITDFKTKTPASQEQVLFVYNELLKATNYASNITIKNIKQNDNVMKLTINN